MTIGRAYPSRFLIFTFNREVFSTSEWWPALSSCFTGAKHALRALRFSIVSLSERSTPAVMAPVIFSLSVAALRVFL